MSALASERHQAPSSEAWQPFIYWKVIHAPASYGVCVIANSHREPILVAHGVLRTELWRLLNDPGAEKNDAYYFRTCVASDEAEAQRTAAELLGRLEAEGRSVLRGGFET